MQELSRYIMPWGCSPDAGNNGHRPHSIKFAPVPAGLNIYLATTIRDFQNR